MTPAKHKHLILLAGACALAIACAVPVAYRPVLRSLGHVLVAEDPVTPADMIVISVDAKGAGILEAGDLVEQGISKHVAIFPEQPGKVNREFIRRGVEHYDPVALGLRQLSALGVSGAEQLPSSVAGTGDEGQILSAWCDQRGFDKVIFIGMPDHSRRTRRVMERAFAGHKTRILVHASRYSEFDPEAWWQTRGGLRIELVELEKLLLDIAMHPLG